MRKIKPIKICFVAPHAFPLFATNLSGYFGGAEVQISQIIKELLKDRYFQVSLITGDYGQANVIKDKGLTIYKCFREAYNRYFELLRTCLIVYQIDADIYIARTASNLLFPMALFCRLFKKKLVYMVAHDWDCQKQFFNPLFRVHRTNYYRGLRMADLIFSQTEKQEMMLRKNFALKSTIMKSVIKTSNPKNEVIKNIILWVGRADRWKRPLEFIKLAKAFPKENFTMICRRSNDPSLFKMVNRAALKQKNLEFFESMTFNNSDAFYQQAKIFINTSIAEGFPNTFLQAGLDKTPILSLTVDPDHYLNYYHCGLVAKNNPKLMTELCRKMIKDKRSLKIMGQNHYDYVITNHSLKNINNFKQAVKRMYEFN